MELLKKIGVWLLVIFFPIGIVYCILHTLGNKFITFLGGIFLLIIGVIISPYLFQNNEIIEFVSLISNYLKTFLNIF